MTWNEFKELVENELAARGASHDIEIWYIDISPDSRNVILVDTEDETLSVS